MRQICAALAVAVDCLPSRCPRLVSRRLDEGHGRFSAWAVGYGTFLVLVLRPDVAFQGSNPLVLTVEGEFVVKNLVLLSAGLVIGSRLRRLPPWVPPADR